ncbi:MAG: D-amino acid aminotransferase [Pseudomonadota bacterium]
MHDALTGTVFLNGQYLPAAEAKISVLDRGFIFGDGVYEVIPVYGGRLFRLPHHLERLDHSLQGIRLHNPLDHTTWQQRLEELIDRNGGGEQSLYLQVTRGVAPRDHRFPTHTEPTVFAMSTPLGPVPDTLREGVAAITVEDIRWKLCNIKAIALLPNILLRQQAADAGAAEAIMLRDGFVTEGSASNLFIVNNGVVLTPPKSNLLLPGITRDLVVELCHDNAVPCVEGAISQMQLQQADEIWLTSSSKEITPVIRLDQAPVGQGRPGPLWQRLIALYQTYKQAFREGRAE